MGLEVLQQQQQSQFMFVCMPACIMKQKETDNFLYCDIKNIPRRQTDINANDTYHGSEQYEQNMTVNAVLSVKCIVGTENGATTQKYGLSHYK